MSHRHTDRTSTVSATRPVASAAAMLILVGIVFGQSAPQQNGGKLAAEPPSDRFEFMSRELALTANQKPKVKAIVDAQMGEWETLQKNKTLNGSQKMARMEEINQTAQAKIDKLLTADQRKKLAAIMEASKPLPAKPAPNRKPKPKATAPEP